MTALYPRMPLASLQAPKMIPFPSAATPAQKSSDMLAQAQANTTARGECRISAEESRVEIWIVPTNEELIVARLAARLLKG